MQRRKSTCKGSAKFSTITPGSTARATPPRRLCKKLQSSATICRKTRRRQRRNIWCVKTPFPRRKNSSNKYSFPINSFIINAKRACAGAFFLLRGKDCPQIKATRSPSLQRYMHSKARIKHIFPQKYGSSKFLKSIAQIAQTQLKRRELAKLTVCKHSNIK